MPFRFLESLADQSVRMLRLLRVLLAASVLVPTLLFAGIAWRDYQAVVAQTERNMHKTLQVLHEHMLKVFDTVEQVLDRVDERTRGMEWDEIARSEALSIYLKTLSDELPQLAVLGMADAEGRVRALSESLPRNPRSIADREYFRVLKERDTGIFIGEPIIGNSTGTRQFNVSRRRTTPGGPDGAFGGVLVAGLDTDYFNDFYKRVVSGGKESIAIVREDGVVLSRFPVPQGDGGPRMIWRGGLLRAVEGGRTEGFYRNVSQFDGIERLLVFKRVAPYPLYVVYGVPQTEIVAAWRRNMLLYAAFAIPATLALAGITWLAMRRARSEVAAVRRWAEEVRTRESLEAALRQSQKLEALGQLTGGVAHDFNNLLTAALTNLHLMARTLPEPSARYMDGARSALERAKTLTSQLLAFSRQEAVDPKVIDLGESLRGMADLLERSIRADIALDWDLAAEPMRVEVDPVQVELAVLNLVVNARDAMPQGGRIRIAARPEANGTVRLEVADTGAGMPPEVAARAFEPFFTTKSTGKGTGLGLSMVYGFARQSGGSAAIDSAPGQGTTVRITLPLTAKPRTEDAPAPESAAPGAEKTLRVLVVEDNALVLMATVDGLSQEGFEVATADHGAAALELLEADSRFDAIVSDVVMPYGVSGIDLARRVHERWPHIRVMLISGYSPESLTGLGADTAVLPKPFTPDQLAARIRALFRPAKAA
ncbi:ATP-binding protein [Azospirillum sp. sgz302134]